VVGRFSAGDLGGWEERSFHGRTIYRIVRRDGRRVLEADSRGTASSLIRRVRVDPARTPILEWSWRVDGVLDGLDERSRAGDDYAARVYVIFSGGAFFWRTRALNYVWSGGQEKGAVWPSAFTGNSMMFALRSPADGAGRWFRERRDIREDFRRAFGGEPPPVDAVAVMSDTDQSGRSVRAWYGDIRFVAEGREGR